MMWNLFDKSLTRFLITAALGFTFIVALVAFFIGHGCHSPKPPPVPPTPEPAQIVEPGLRVLIVYETDEFGLAKMPEAQKQILFGKEIRDYLNQHCIKGPDGKTPEWRMLDKDADMVHESKLWQNAFKRPRASAPWMLVSNGKTGFEGPLPATAKEALEIITRYAP